MARFTEYDSFIRFLRFALRTNAVDRHQYVHKLLSTTFHLQIILKELSKFLKVPCQKSYNRDHFWLIIFLIIGLGTFPVIIFDFLLDSPVTFLIRIFVSCSFGPSVLTFAMVLFTGWIALINPKLLHGGCRPEEIENPPGRLNPAPLLSPSERSQSQGTENESPLLQAPERGQPEEIENEPLLLQVSERQQAEGMENRAGQLQTSERSQAEGMENEAPQAESLKLPIELLDVCQWFEFMTSKSSIRSPLRL
jgi:hypothetical protein